MEAREVGPLRALTGWQLVVLAVRAGSLRALVRAVLILLGLKRVTPRPGELLPMAQLSEVPDLGDTGGGGWYRPPWRKQDPSADPREPGGGESSSRGNDHGWSNCTLASGAMALAFHTQGKDDKWGGDLRHHQSDLEGGTDLNDLKQAWAYYGETLSIRSGAGWEALKDDRAAGRMLVVQGEGNVPGSESFDGGHACAVSPETHSDGRWLFGDPLAGGWQWVSASSIKEWMQRWSSSYAWARSAAHPPDDPDDGGGSGEPTPDTTPFAQKDINAAQTKADAAGYRRGLAAGSVAQGDADVGAWLDWLRAPVPGTADVWDGGAWSSLAQQLGAEQDDPCAPDVTAPARWSRGAVLAPPADAHAALSSEAVWGAVGWRERLWR